MSELSKVTIRISGKAMNEANGYELRYLIKSLDSFSKLSEMRFKILKVTTDFFLQVLKSFLMQMRLYWPFSI